MPVIYRCPGLANMARAIGQAGLYVRLLDETGQALMLHLADAVLSLDGQRLRILEAYDLAAQLYIGSAEEQPDGAWAKVRPAASATTPTAA